jgi:cytochrome b561
MPLRNDAERWGGLSIALHWLTFLLVLGMATVGLLMVQMEPSPLKVQVYALHKSFGLTVLALTVLRLLWRASGRVPAPVPGTPAWQQRIASATHGALYALLLAVPLSGWWFNSAAGFPLRWFGLVKLPKLTGFDPAIKALARETHETLFFVLAGLVAVHAAAALWHHYRQHDRTLLRMLSPSAATASAAPVAPAQGS